MAASMVRCQIRTSVKSLCNQNLRHASSSYYVLLPEVPTDTPETNPIMRVEENPKFSQINVSKAISGCAKLSLEYDVEMGKHIKDLGDPSTKKDFDSVFNPIEKISVPLNFAWKTAKQLNYVNINEGYNKAFQRIHRQVESSRNERWISETLYNAVKEVAADEANLDEFQMKCVKMYLLEARLNGIELFGSDKKNFLQILRTLLEQKTHYKNRVMLSHNMFSHIIKNFKDIEEMPKDFLTELAVNRDHPEQGPWKITLNQDVYHNFMEYCSDRKSRWNLWQAHNARASVRYDDQQLSNHIAIRNIREARKDLAEMLGYENFAQLSMETKMAGSVDNAINMIESLKSKLKDKCYNQLEELQEFAYSIGFSGDLELWDVAYYRRKQKEHLFQTDANSFAAYFPFTKVLHGLFEVCSDLFDIEIKDCTGEAETWHSSVMFFRVFDKHSKEELSTFYLDPYYRDNDKFNSAWVENGRERSLVCGTKPISYMNFSFPSPTSNQESLLNLEDLTTLFYEFGNLLQQQLTTVPHSEIAGQRNIQWDALKVPAHVTALLFKHPSIIQRLSSHHRSGEKISMEVIQNHIKAEKHLESFDVMKQLYYSAMDLEMYTSEDHWQQVYRKIWMEFMPFELQPEDYHPCSFQPIFSGYFPAAYYSHEWSKMIAADIYGAFDEIGLENLDDIKPVAKRYRDTFLSLGGGVSASEVFRRFRGRDPSQEALIRQYSQS